MLKRDIRNDVKIDLVKTRWYYHDIVPTCGRQREPKEVVTPEPCGLQGSNLLRAPSSIS